MLQQMRNPKVLKAGLWIIIILVIPSFVAFYGFSQSGSSTSGMAQGDYASATTPGGDDVELDRFDMQAAENELMREYVQTYMMLSNGQPLTPALQAAIRQAVTPKEMVDYALSEVALMELARESGLRVSDAQVTKALREAGYTNERLNAELRRSRKSEAQFLAEIRSDIMDSRSEELVRSMSKVSILELWQEYRLQNIRARVEYARLPPTIFNEQVQVTDEDIRAYFEEHKDEYVKPEERVYQYILTEAPPAAPPAQPSEEAVRARYDEIDPTQDTRFADEIGTRLSQIVLEVNDDETTESVIEKIEILRTQINDSNFAQIANESSEDLANIQFTGNSVTRRGGEVPERLNERNREQIIEQYGQVWYDIATKLQTGEVSDPFESNGKFYILKANAVSDGKLPFETARGIIEAELRRAASDEARRVRDEQIAQLQLEMRETVETRSTIEAIADALGKDVRQTSPTLSSSTFFPAIGDLSQSREVIAELEEGDISPVLKAANGNLVVLQVDKVLPERPQTVDEVRDQIERVVRIQKAAELAREAAAVAAERVRSGDQLTSVSAELKYDYKITEEFVLGQLPTDLQNSPDLGRFIYRNDPGAVDVMQGGIGQSDIIVVKLIEKREPDIQQFVEDSQRYELGLQMSKRDAVLYEYRREAVKQMEPEYNLDYIGEGDRRGRRRRGR